MFNDGNLRGIRIQHPRHVNALEPGSGIGNGMHTRGSGAGKSLKAYKKSFFVHHLKHLPHPFSFLTQEIADAGVVFSKGQGAGGESVNAHLFLNPRADNIVSSAGCSIRFGDEFGHNKEGKPPCAGRIAFDARQDHMNNIVR